MVTVSVSYGYKSIEFDVPDRVLGEIFTPSEFRYRGSDISTAMKNPLKTPMLNNLVSGKNVVVLVEDYTRNEPHDTIVNAIAQNISDAKNIIFLVATGSHNPSEELNRDVVASIENSINKYRLKADWEIHSAYANRWDNYGITSRGTVVEVNPLLKDAEVIVVGADMKPHYFAGYSCAVKDFLPGVCSFKTIEANHALALHPKARAGMHPFHPKGSRRVNPVSEDMVEAMNFIIRDRVAVTLSTVSYRNEILWSAFGDIKTVCGNGIKYIDDNMAFRIGRKYRYVVISPGGYPQDETLYNAQRCLELTYPIFNKGAKVLLLAHCNNGIASTSEAVEHFYNPLINGLEWAIESIERRYHLYSHKAYRLARFLMEHEVFIHTMLPRDVVETIGMTYVDNPSEVISQWSNECTNTGDKIAFIDGGNKIMLI